MKDFFLAVLLSSLTTHTSQPSPSLKSIKEILDAKKILERRIALNEQKDKIDLEQWEENHLKLREINHYLQRLDPKIIALADKSNVES